MSVSELAPEQEALEELREIRDSADGYVVKHERADGVLVKLLHRLGYTDVVDAYERIEGKGYE